MLPSELELRCPEVQQQADLDSCRSEVVDELDFVRGSEGLHRLEFDDDASLHQQIGLELANKKSIVIDGDGFSLSADNTAFLNSWASAFW